MPRHRILIDTRLVPGPLEVEGDEAHHAARVKRLAEGDAVEILDGRGSIGSARVVRIGKERGLWRMGIEVEEVRNAEPLRTRVEVFCPAPKGARLADMIDSLSQVGAASWSPLDTARAVTEPGAGKLQRLERTALEAAKQCGRPWVLEIGPSMTIDAAVKSEDNTAVVIADASGEGYGASGAERIRVLIGPEGGWSARELERFGEARRCSFGPHVMRIETAATAAAAIILDRERAWLSPPPPRARPA